MYRANKPQKILAVMMGIVVAIVIVHRLFQF
jgi:hypothetical protein